MRALISPHLETTVSQSIEAEARSTSSHVPGYEPWLGVAGAACVPVLLMFVLPRSFLWPLGIIGGLLFVVALVMLVRQERRQGQNRPDK
jgi:hypothetical protein